MNKLKLVGVAGRMGSGKDTIGDFLVSRPGGWRKMAFAGPIKDVCRSWFDFTWSQVNGTLEEKNALDKRYPRPDGTFLTPREAMQFIGTEIGRKLYPNVWVDLALRRAKDAIDVEESRVVFTDCRFVNEAKAIRDAGGQVWRVRRASADRPQATHASEQMIDTSEFGNLVTHSVFNDGSLSDLYDQVRGLVE